MSTLSLGSLLHIERFEGMQKLFSLLFSRKTIKEEIYNVLYRHLLQQKSSIFRF